MRNKYLSWIDKVVDALKNAKISPKQKLWNMFSPIKQNKDSNDFSTLLPKDSLEVRDAYKRALDFAFDKKNHIHNLGITGSLGIGKTSVVQSYLKKSCIQWIEISLADFADKSKENRILELEKKVLLQLIVSQTSKYNIRKIFSWTLLFVMGVILWHYYIGFPVLVSEMVITKINAIVAYVTNSIIAAGCVTIFILVFIGTVCKVLADWCEGIHYKIKLNFFSQVDVDLEKIQTQEDFDKHLKMLLKYFRNVSANVVLIEDLDRFNEIDIFIKLRELNQLINVALKDDVIFVYVMRETVLNDALRKTKFFDFIVPILPEAYENYGEGIFRQKILKLLNKFDVATFEADSCSHLIRCIAPQIRDYRLLNNICNEFKVYAEILTERMQHDSVGENAFHMYSLLALIIYKNFYPCDFEKTCNQQGVLSGIFNNRYSNALKLRAKMLDEVQKLKDENNKLHENIRNSIVKWKGKVRDKLGLSAKESHQFHFPDIVTTSWEELFEGHMMVVHTDIQTILSGWESKEFCIQDDNKVEHYQTFNSLNIEIGGLKNDLLDIFENIKLGERRNSDIGQISAGASRVVSMSLYQQLQIPGSFKFMLGDLPKEGKMDSYDTRPAIIMLSIGPKNTTGGFLDESYRHYLSVFQKGGISEVDNFFLAAVQSHKRLPYTYSLQDPSRILEQVRPDECAQVAIWNKSIIDYLIKNNTYFGIEPYMHNIATMLLDQSLDNDEMIWEYFENSTEEEQSSFFFYLRNGGRSVSSLFWNNTSIPESHKLAYAKAIIMMPIVSDYGDIFINSFLMQPMTLINFDWKDSRFMEQFKYYTEKANLNWPSVDAVKEKTINEPEEKRIVLLNIMENLGITTGKQVEKCLQ